MTFHCYLREYNNNINSFSISLIEVVVRQVYFEDLQFEEGAADLPVEVVQFEEEEVEHFTIIINSLYRSFIYFFSF